MEIKLGPKNPRAWIQAIMDRKARGDPTLSPVAYRMALEAQSGQYRAPAKEGRRK